MIPPGTILIHQPGPGPGGARRAASKAGLGPTVRGEGGSCVTLTAGRALRSLRSVMWSLVSGGTVWNQVKWRELGCDDWRVSPTNSCWLSSPGSQGETSHSGWGGQRLREGGRGPGAPGGHTFAHPKASSTACSGFVFHPNGIHPDPALNLAGA